MGCGGRLGCLRLPNSIDKFAALIVVANVIVVVLMIKFGIRRCPPLVFFAITYFFRLKSVY